MNDRFKLMKEEDKSYLESCKNFTENLELCVRLSENRINYLIKDIEISEKQLVNEREGLEGCKMRVAMAKKVIDDFIKEFEVEETK